MSKLSNQKLRKVISWWNLIDKQIFFSFLFLLLLGLFFSFSSTSPIVGDKLNKETYFFFIKHLTYVLISIFIIIFISFQKKEFIEKYLLAIFLVTLFFLILVPLIGTEVKGSKRWLDLKILPRFQPIELIKPFFILLVAKVILNQKTKNIYFNYFFSFLILSVLGFLLILQPDLGQTLLISTTWISIVFVSGVNLIYFIFFALFFLSAIALIVFLFPSKLGYIFLRLKTFLDPSKGDNFQSQKAIEAIKQGGLTGEGLGEGILKERIPEAHTDYIISVISEEFGIIFVLLIIFIYLFIAFKVFNKVFTSNKSDFIKLSLVGLTTILILQAFIHIGVNIRLLPTTGMTMPFLSYGGSSLIGTSLISGIIINFTKKEKTNLI